MYDSNLPQLYFVKTRSNRRYDQMETSERVVLFFKTIPACRCSYLCSRQEIYEILIEIRRDRWDIQRLLDCELAIQFSNYCRTLYVPAPVALCTITRPLMRFITNLCAVFFDVRGSGTLSYFPLRPSRPFFATAANLWRDNT